MEEIRRYRGASPECPRCGGGMFAALCYNYEMEMDDALTVTASVRFDCESCRFEYDGTVVIQPAFCEIAVDPDEIESPEEE